MDEEGSRDLEREAEIALARLGVVEELGWPIAILISMIAYVKWDLAWYIAVPLTVLLYLAVRYPYARAQAAAEDAYHREAGLGKYVNDSASDDDV